MDDFNATILTLFDNINKEKANSKKKNKSLIDNYLIEKQYLAYYIYRIWIKYRRLMEYTNTPSSFNKILTYLNVPSKYFKYNVTYPMQDKMVNNEKQLDLIILNILNQFNKCNKYFTNINSKQLSTNTSDNNNSNKSKSKKEKLEEIETITEKGQYRQLTELLKIKTFNVILNDIQTLKILIPNLSKPGGRVSIWEKLTPYIDEFNNNNMNSNIDFNNTSVNTNNSSK